jgi:predicted nucleic acid-binding protein
MIASAARSRGASVVTRDLGAFEDCGIALINPWEPP